MKSATFVSGVALALLLVAPSLGAQPHGQGLPKITVDVPFDFMVGQVMFPAGNYVVKPGEIEPSTCKPPRGERRSSLRRGQSARLHLRARRA